MVRRTRPGISRFRVRCFASPRNDEGERTTSDALQPRLRVLELGLAGQRRVALLLLLLDELLGCVGDELLVAELLVDALDVGLGLGDLFSKAGALGGEIDDALKRQRSHLAAHDELRGAPGSG